MNVQVTPSKLTENTVDMLYQNEELEKREEAINNVRLNAPGWFAEVFEFMIKDLNRISTVSSEVATYKAQCDRNTTEIQDLQQKVELLEKRNIELEEHIQRLETYSRKNNLLIKGLPETGPDEDVVQISKNFLANTLKLQNPGDIILQAAHRLGKPPHLQAKSARRPRGIIVHCLSLSDRSNTWRNRFKLKGSPFILTEDFPPPIQAKRRKLEPFFKAAKRHRSVGKCSLQGDVLIIDGQKYTVDTLDSLPHGLNTANLGRCSEKRLQYCDGTAFFGRDSFLSNFHPCRIEEGNLTFPTVEHYFQYKKALYFQDDRTALAIYKACSPAQAKALSYQIKDFDLELWKSVASQNMLKACTKKFQQNDELGQKLKETTGILVEANPKDTFFHVVSYFKTLTWITTQGGREKIYWVTFLAKCGPHCSN